ncbi:protein DEFECTIVE IN MERISTEM SILENCING 3-like isoform X2 [Diospyros lotus]|uniref:protein DEFECTIVE IN MERISTEM SILENCING 3-like isoform X2 n=1 Tax=Diospyros lotus TaxID=55363 RepID=UPI002255C5AA|nr:protein DEFECTIVE IN MERISTEM SILENCING 3-like isoform X2 [Diospyros lotus]
MQAVVRLEKANQLETVREGESVGEGECPQAIAGGEGGRSHSVVLTENMTVIGNGTAGFSPRPFKRPPPASPFGPSSPTASGQSPLPIHTRALPIQIPTALENEGQNASSLISKDGMQNGALFRPETVIYTSKKLQDDLEMLGKMIKKHEDNMKSLKSQKSSIEESILDIQVSLGKYYSSSVPMMNDEGHAHEESEEETVQNILKHEKSAAGVLCLLKARHGSQASHLLLTKDVLGIVATLGQVDDDNLSRLLSEYLGMETMLAVVCKTYSSVKALETYETDGSIIKTSGLHGLGASLGRPLDGRFIAICLENLQPYFGEFLDNDSQRRLDLLKPRLPNGESPPGFLGFAVNMINIDNANLSCLTANGHGLRETLFYNLFSRLQVYRTRADMLQAHPCISHGAISLDGGMLKTTGLFSLGNRHRSEIPQRPWDVKFVESF